MEVGIEGREEGEAKGREGLWRLGGQRREGG